MIKSVRTSDVLGSDGKGIVAINELLDFFFPVRIYVLGLDFGWPRKLLQVKRPLHPSVPESSIDVPTLRGY